MKEVVSVRKCRHRRISSHLGQVIIIIMADTLILMLTMSVMRSCCSRLVTECPSLGPVWHVSCLLRAGRPLGTTFCAIFSFFLKRDLAFRLEIQKQTGYLIVTRPANSPGFPGSLQVLGCSPGLPAICQILPGTENQACSNSQQ